MRVPRAHRPGRAGRPRRRTPASPCAPGSTRAARSTCPSSARCSPPTWGRSSCPRRPSRSRTRTTSPAGRCCRSTDLRDLREFATGVGARIHLDGARIWNAHVATGVPLAEYGAIADVLAVCLSKGLGAPVGSLMVGTADAIAEARIWRKRIGGGMRQVGILAAAGLHALEHHVERLADDHEHARLLAEACGVDPATVDTNIVVVDRPDAADLVARGPRRRRPGGHRRTHRRPPRHPPRHHPRRRREGRRHPLPPHLTRRVLTRYGADPSRVDAVAAPTRRVLTRYGADPSRVDCRSR